MKVYKTPCKNCLLSPDAIVSPARRKEIVKKCADQQTFFVCHKASIQGGEGICCKTFYDKLGHVSQMIRIAERLGVVEEVEQLDCERLTSWADTHNQ